MPFTPAHPAIILPLIKVNPRYLSATGLIAGSVAPDFEYFFTMSVNGVHGHTLAGLFYFNVPVACFLAFVFHLIIKRRLIDNLPAFFQSRLQPARELDFTAYIKKNIVAFLCAALIGSASHIFWDGFTHSEGYFANELPFYHGSFIPFEGVKYPLWYALQQISTYVGLTIVFLYVWSIKPVSFRAGRPSLMYWIFIFLTTGLIVSMRFRFDPSSVDLGNLVVATMSALCIAFLFAGMIPFRTSSYG